MVVDVAANQFGQDGDDKYWSKEWDNLVRRLGNCTMLPGSSEKRFIRGLNAQRLADGKVHMTLKQKDWLEKIAHRYRKQLELHK